MRISGMKTGLDVEGLVKQLMSVERRPVEMLQRKMSVHEGRSSAWQDLSSRLKALQDLSDQLRTRQTFSERSVNVSDKTVATVTASSIASTGAHSLEVRSLATAHRVESGVFSSTITSLGYSGTIVIDGKAIEITPEDTLDSIANKIAMSDVPAICRVVKLASEQYKIVITSTGMGRAATLSYQDSAAASYAVSSDTPEVATVTATGATAAGDYNVSVSSLAKAQVIRSDAQVSRHTALGYQGAFQLNGVTVNIQASHSLDDIAHLINSTYTGVTATVDDEGGLYSLTLTSQASGLAGSISFSDTNGVLRGLGVLYGPGLVKNEVEAARDATYHVNGATYSSSSNTVSVIQGLNLQLHSTGESTVRVTAEGGVLRSLGILNSSGELANETQKAQDAVFSIDGYTFTRQSNTISDSLPGLTISLKRTGMTSVELSDSSDQLLSKIKEWVGKYNEVLDSLKHRTKYDPKTKQGGPLSGDRLARDLIPALRLQALRKIPGLSALGSLTEIGISTGKYGTQDADRLVIDEDKLKDKLESSRAEVMKLFGSPTDDARNPSDGIALAMHSLLDSYIKADTGFVARHTSSIDSMIDVLQKQVGSLETRLAKRESELYKQYSRMEVQLTKLQNMSASVGVTLDKLM